MEVKWPPRLCSGASHSFAVGTVQVSLVFSNGFCCLCYFLLSFVPLHKSCKFSKGSRGQENPWPKWSHLPFSLWEITQVMPVLELTLHLAGIPRHPPEGLFCLSKLVSGFYCPLRRQNDRSAQWWVVP